MSRSRRPINPPLSDGMFPLANNSVIEAANAARVEIEAGLGEVTQEFGDQLNEDDHGFQSCMVEFLALIQMIACGKEPNRIKNACRGFIGVFRKALAHLIDLRTQLDAAYATQELIARAKSADPDEVLTVLLKRFDEDRDLIEKMIEKSYRIPEEEVGDELDGLAERLEALERELLEQQGELESFGTEPEKDLAVLLGRITAEYPQKTPREQFELLQERFAEAESASEQADIVRAAITDIEAEKVSIAERRVALEQKIVKLGEERVKIERTELNPLLDRIAALHGILHAESVQLS